MLNVKIMLIKHYNHVINSHISMYAAVMHMLIPGKK